MTPYIMAIATVTELTNNNNNKKVTQQKHTVQVQCMILDAWGWCTETTQRDGTGRERGVSGWGTRVYLWRIHVDVWQNQYNIVINLQLK